MTPEEVIWRTESVLRSRFDRFRIASKWYPSIDFLKKKINMEDVFSDIRLVDVGLGEWNLIQEPLVVQWKEKLIDEAEKIAKHKLSLFNHKDCHLGDPIDWNRDYVNGITAPRKFSASIDHRDLMHAGDCKIIWELNRHHHLVVLGRAYRATGNIIYAESVVAHLSSWLQQCPYGIGINWTSPLELGIRLINWVWAIDLIRDSGLVSGEFRDRLIHSLYLHIWEINRKYSRGSSANNHLIGEAAGVFIASSYFIKLPNAEIWRAESKTILFKELFNQSFSDGCTKEQALGYQIFVLQLFIVSGLMARASGDDFSGEYWLRIEKMLEFAGNFSEEGEILTLFGDYDDGYVLDLGDKGDQLRGLLSVGAILFNRPDFKSLSGGYKETARCLMGTKGEEKYNLVNNSYLERLESMAFPESGHYILRSVDGMNNGITVTFDCGDLGFGPLAAHGHADALSFTLHAFGTDIFVDPGTYIYLADTEWRNYFRSTRAHNTIEIDGKDQSIMSGPFMWEAKAPARCVEWEPEMDGGFVTGEHYGYLRFPDPVTHIRKIVMNGGINANIKILDKIVANKSHNIFMSFHLSERCTITHQIRNEFEIAVNGRTVILFCDPQLTYEIFTGSINPILGWVSRGFHTKVPTTSIVGRAKTSGTINMISYIKLK